MAAETAAIGIDIGSRTTEIVCLQGGRMTHAEAFETGHNPLDRLVASLEGMEADCTIATGYGRHLAEQRLGCRTVTEILACARAARRLCPDAESAIDIGGQDSKAIELSGRGGFGRFEMNDRCAAGTGRFLEVMADTLGYSLEELAGEAMLADMPTRINSMCTVFAESEVVSLIARGEDRQRIALGLHLAAARRVAAMASRVRTGRKVLFVGGVANNPCMAKLLGEELNCELHVPDRPELACALGAALVAVDRLE